MLSPKKNIVYFDIQLFKSIIQCNDAKLYRLSYLLPVIHMYNPEKEFYRILIECLGKDGKSISALSKDLEGMGFKYHRLIVTGYLRALTDTGVLRERDVPPSKIYQPVKPVSESIYETIGKACRKLSPDADELILYVLFKLFRRPIFTSELKLAGVNRPIGKEALEHEMNECKKVLRRAGNVLPSQSAVFPAKDFPEQYIDVLSDTMLDIKDSKHLVMETKQTRLL